MPQFTGKNVLLTGALGTVCRAVVARYAEDGATIIALDRPDAENPQALLDGIVKGVRYFGCDLNDLAGTEKAVTALAEEVGCHHGLAYPEGTGVAHLGHAGGRLLRRGADRGYPPLRATGDHEEEPAQTVHILRLD